MYTVLTRRTERPLLNIQDTVMILRIVFLWLALLGVAVSTSAAQRGQGRPGEPDGRARQEQRDHRRGGPDDGPVPKLLRHRAELGLTDEQTRRLQEIDRKMEEQNRPYVEKLIQIRREMRGRPGVRPENMTEAERAAFQSQMEAARPLWDQIRKNNHAAMHEVGEVLSAEQKAQLRELLEKQEKQREQNGSPGPDRSRPGRGI